MTSILQIYLVIPCLLMCFSFSFSNPSKDRSPHSIKVNGVDATTTDDLFKFVTQNFSPKLKNKASSTKSHHQTSSRSEKEKSKKHHREKRFIWITKEKRIVLPPGTQLVLTPTLGRYEKRFKFSVTLTYKV